jgi:hypothetical protein
VRNLGRGGAWLDGGDERGLIRSKPVREGHSGSDRLARCLPRRDRYRRGFIDRASLARLAELAPTSDYQTYLLQVLEDPLIGLN